jgi:hypothetical protein
MNIKNRWNKFAKKWIRQYIDKSQIPKYMQNWN